MAQGTYYENISITTSKDFTLEGGWDNTFTARSSDASLTVIDGNASGSVFSITGGGNIIIDGFTITNGTASGVFVYAYSGSINLILTNNIITKNSAVAYGGGIYISDQSGSAKFKIASNKVINNSANRGGGIYSEGKQGTIATITVNTIRDNSAYIGGGVYISGYISEYYSPIISFNKITYNKADSIGWGGNGGGIAVVNASPNITNNYITSNEAFRRCEYCWPTGGGGGVVVFDSGIPKITNNIINNNTASWGGGMFIYKSLGDVLINNNSILKNIAESGGGIYTYGSTATYTFANNIIAANNAITSSGHGTGGGFYNYGMSKLVSNTIVCNNADIYSGIVNDSSSAQPLIVNTILWNNIHSMSYGGNNLGPFISPSSIIYSDLGPPDFNNSQHGIYHNISADPLFADSQNGDFRLRLYSPLIDKGDPTILDPNGSISDIGAIPYGLTDSDGDSIPDAVDNCPAIFNPEQADSNNNGIGDACEAICPLSIVAFSSFTAEVEIEIGPLANDDKFEVKANFTLGTGSNGINPVSEDMSLTVGTATITIPAGSFKLDKKGRFKFEGIINGAALEIMIKPLGGNSYEFKAEGEGFDLTGTVNPVDVKLTIGNDGGNTTAMAEFDRNG